MAGECIVIKPYDQSWPVWFAHISTFLMPALNGISCIIAHVGSTSILGMAAKPIIDIDIVVDRSEFPHVRDCLATIGYRHQGDLGIPDREVFKQIELQAHYVLPPHHLYVCISGTNELRKHLLFRDYLRTHFDDARQYAELKYQLAEQYREDRTGYTEAKSPLIWRIMQKAEAWARETQWRMSPDDAASRGLA